VVIVEGALERTHDVMAGYVDRGEVPAWSHW